MRRCAELVEPADAEILQDPDLTGGMWDAHDISRMVAETGWRPRPVRAALHASMVWLAAERAGAGGAPT